jgi:nicotinamide-nucleotide amidase
MKAEVISIGTEILLGKLIDTHASFLAEQLSLIGIDLYFISSVGDNYQRLLGVLKQAWERSDLIIATGGLGPTQDDLTREAISGLLSEKPEVDLDLKRTLITYYKQRGQDMPLSNIKQATLIPSAIAIQNPRGTAPGWWVEKDGRIIIAMPGPPIEMQFMWKNEIFPRLQERNENVILSRTLKAFGLGESKVEEFIAHLLSSRNPTLATYAKQDGTYLRITAKASKLEEAQEMISKRELKIRSILGEYIWGVDDDTLESAVGQLLSAKGLSVAVADSFSSGFLTYILTDAPQYTSCFKGGLITTSEEGKISLGLDPRLVADNRTGEIATAMASLVRRKLDANIGIGIEGHSESLGGIKMGTIFIAIESEQNPQPVVQSYSGRYYQMRRRSAYCTLFEVWKFLNST